MIRWYDTCYELYELSVELMGAGYGDWEELEELQEQGVFGFADDAGDIHMWAGNDTHPEEVIAYVEQAIDVDTYTAYGMVRERLTAPRTWMN